MQFSNELRGQHSKNMQGVGEFHHSPMQVEVRCHSPYRREGGTLKNVAGVITNATITTKKKNSKIVTTKSGHKVIIVEV